jgi:hypothetical protein
VCSKEKRKTKSGKGVGDTSIVRMLFAGIKAFIAGLSAGLKAEFALFIFGSSSQGGCRE